VALCKFILKSAEACGSQQLIGRPSSVNVVLRTPWPATRHAGDAAIPFPLAAVWKLVESTEGPFEIVGGLEVECRELYAFTPLPRLDTVGS